LIANGQLRLFFLVGSIGPQLEEIALKNNMDTNTSNAYVDVFSMCLLLGTLFTPIIGWIMDNKGILPGSLVTLTVGLVFNILIMIPILQVQYVTFIFYVCFRAFFYSFLVTFMSKVFPFEHFGKILGSVYIIGALFTLTQNGLFALNQVYGGFFFIKPYFARFWSTNFCFSNLYMES